LPYPVGKGGNIKRCQEDFVMISNTFRDALLGGVALAATALVAAPASAAVILDFGFVPLGGSLTYSPSAGNLGNATSISGFSSITSYVVNTIFAPDTTGVLSGSTVGLTLPNTVSFVPGLQSISAVTKTFTGSAGAYSVVFNQLFAAGNVAGDSMAWVLEGIATLPAGGGTQPDFLTAAFTSASLGTANVSFTETSTAPAIIITTTPEPASMAILGAGLLALGAARRRRREV
jgi:hypothetical protein